MTVGAKKTAYKIIEDSPFEFYMTGNEYFGLPNPDETQIFFTKTCEEVEKYLLDEGFILHEIPFKDTTIQKVLRKEKIIIHLIENPEIKAWLQRQLKPIFQKLKPDPRQAQSLWNFAWGCIMKR